MKIEQRPIDQIIPYARNPRVNDGAVASVAASIREFGWRQPIVVDGDGIVVCGHTRLLAARQLNLPQVPVHVAEGLSAAQIKAYRLLDNKSHERSTWDEELLPLELLDLQDLGIDMDLTGFTPEEIEELLAPPPNVGLVDPDDAPDPPAEAITQPGDIWELGQHRLLCGDSTAPEDVQRVLAGKSAAMCATDPPWNVAIGKDSNPRHRQRPGLHNDDLPPEEFESFLSSFIGAMQPHLRGDLYCVLGALEWPTLDRCLRGRGFHWSATIIWVKDMFVLGRSKYHRRYEPLWYGWHGDGKSSYSGGRDQDDVWLFDRPRKSEEHPTMKPVGLIAKAIANSSRPGEVIYEPFCGSGTAIIAAEQLGRRCCAIEISPVFCDVTVKRWEQFTGRKATLLTREKAPAAAEAPPEGDQP